MRYVLIALLTGCTVPNPLQSTPPIDYPPMDASVQRDAAALDASGPRDAARPDASARDMARPPDFAEPEDMTAPACGDWGQPCCEVDDLHKACEIWRFCAPGPQGRRECYPCGDKGQPCCDDPRPSLKCLAGLGCRTIGPDGPITPYCDE